MSKVKVHVSARLSSSSDAKVALKRPADGEKPAIPRVRFGFRMLGSLL